MRAYLTRGMLALAAVGLVALAVLGYLVYLTPPGSRWLAILAAAGGLAAGTGLIVTARPRQDPPGRER